MQEEFNPLLERENYFGDYQKSIDELKNKPQIVEFDRLCFEVFEANEQGKKFLEFAIDRYLMPALAARSVPTYQIDVLWAEGFKDFIRLIQGCVRSHQQRISAGNS